MNRLDSRQKHEEGKPNLVNNDHLLRRSIRMSARPRTDVDLVLEIILAVIEAISRFLFEVTNLAV